MSELSDVFRGSELIQVLHELGCETVSWHEAAEYTGKPDYLPFSLLRRTGWFAEERIAAGVDQNELAWIARWINKNPQCNNWKLSVDRQPASVSPGDYVILECQKFMGGVPAEIRSRMIGLGATEADIDFVLNHVDDSIVAYLPSASCSEAQTLAEIIQTGYTQPVSVGELAGMFAGFHEALQQRANAGEPRTQGVADSLKKISDHLGRESRKGQS